MAKDGWLDDLHHRVSLLMMEVMAEPYPGVAWQVSVDEPRSKVHVSGGGHPIFIELGEEHAGMDDAELVPILRAAARAKMGPGYPPKITVPRMGM